MISRRNEYRSRIAWSLDNTIYVREYYIASLQE